MGSVNKSEMNRLIIRISEKLKQVCLYEKQEGHTGIKQLVIMKDKRIFVPLDIIFVIFLPYHDLAGNNRDRILF